MQSDFIMEIVIAAVAWLVLCVPIWLALWLGFPRMERRPVDSVRCRQCWYDLRATTADTCPECGVNLTQTGVWPIGKPNRAKVVHLTMLWFWLSVVSLMILVNLYVEFSSRLVLYFDVEQPILAVEQPQSGAYTRAYITLHGQGLRWFPGEGVPDGFEPTAVSIEVYTAGAKVQAVTLDPDTIRLIPHPIAHDAAAYERVRAGNQMQIDYGDIVSAQTLAEYYPIGVDPETDRQVVADMHNLLAFAALASERGQLGRAYEDNQALAAACRSYAPEYGSHNARYVALNDIYGWPTYPPDWIAFIFLGLGIIVIALGVLRIRRACYRRDAVVWEDVKATAPNLQA